MIDSFTLWHLEWLIDYSFISFSPSDLEADFEDNQDYDSTVSQSDTNLTLLGQASPSPQPGLGNKLRTCRSPDNTRPNNSSHRDDTFSRPVSYPSRFRDEPDFENLHLHAAQNNHHHHTHSRLSAHNSEGIHHHHYHHHRPNLRDYRGSSLDSAESNSKLIARNKDLENVSNWLTIFQRQCKKRQTLRPISAKTFI